MLKSVIKSAPVAVTLLLLGYVAAFARLEVVKTGVPEFRARSREAMLSVPRKVGDWVAESVEIDARARELLQANAGLSFRYKNAARRQEAIYMVVQVEDARFMSGHAPIHCYPGTGWTIDSQTAKTWVLGKDGEFTINGTEYRMHRRSGGQEHRWNVRSFYVFPDGTFGGTLAEIDAAAEDYRKLAYGMAQVQFITFDGMPELQREQAFKELVGSERSLEMFRVLRTGIPK
jgi:hypothetical protein